MPVCATTFVTIEDAWQLGIWTFVTLAIYFLLQRLHDRKHYAVLRSLTFVLPEWLYLIGNALLMLAASYAAWRVYSCADWTMNGVPLGLYLLFVVLFALQVPMVSLIRNSIVAAIWAVVVALVSIAVLIFFFAEDMWAGIVFIVVLLYVLYWVVVHLYLAWNRATLDDQYKLAYESLMYGPDVAAGQRMPATEIDGMSTGASDGRGPIVVTPAPASEAQLGAHAVMSQLVNAQLGSGGSGGYLRHAATDGDASDLEVDFTSGHRRG